MTIAEEPVAFGLAKSLARPGGNITGLAVVPGAEIYGKNLELLKEALLPGARIGVLFNPSSPVNALWLHATEAAARELGVTLVPAGVRSVEDFAQAFAVMQHENARGVVVLLGDPVLGSNKERINELAVRSGLASMWPICSGAEAGGLMSYGSIDLDRFAAHRYPEFLGGLYIPHNCIPLAKCHTGLIRRIKLCPRRSQRPQHGKAQNRN